MVKKEEAQSRIITREGDPDFCPVILVCPHMEDNIGYITEQVAEQLDCYAVINNGFERNEEYDYFKDQCNCNNITHLLNDVPKSEFLDPLMRFCYTVLAHNPMNEAHVFVLHGCSNMVNEKKPAEKPSSSAPVGGGLPSTTKGLPPNKAKALQKVLKEARDDSLDIIVGYGDGKPPSYSCDSDKKDALLYLLTKVVNVAVGKSGGLYSGRRRKNLNQLFRKWYPNSRMHSLQIEIVRNLRETKELADFTSEMLSTTIDNYVDFIQSEKLPEGWEENWKDKIKGIPAI